MGPELDCKGELKTIMEVSPSKEGFFATTPEKQHSGPSISDDRNFNIEALPNESAMLSRRSEDTVINITDVVDSDDKGSSVSESEELTESSSSFGDTDSGTENGAVSNGHGVNYELYDDGTSMHPFDKFSDLLMRKKRLTPHWRNFIRPLMWRLRWMELKIRILEAEVANYGKKIAGDGLKKEHELTAEQCVKCSPILYQNQRVKIMRRRKRKCVNEANDILPHMLQHHLFSCHVNKKTSVSGAHADSPFATPVGKEEIPIKFNMDELDSAGGWQCLESKDDELLEDILQKIELAKMQLIALKVRADKVAGENSDRICASERLGLFASRDASTSSLEALPPRMNREGVTTFPVVVETTEHPYTRLASEKVDDELLIYNNRPIKKEIGVEIQPSSSCKPSTSAQVKDSHRDEGQEFNSQGKRSSVQSAKVRSLSRLNSPQNRRKRARRKARSGRWTRRSSG